MKAHPFPKLGTLALSLLLMPLAGCTAAPAPPNAANNQAAPPAVELEVKNVNGRKLAEFTNGTKGDVGVKLGNQTKTLKPGRKCDFPVRGGEKFNIYSRFARPDGPQWRMWVSSAVSPDPGKTRYLVR